jgi:hypothetical protein
MKKGKSTFRGKVSGKATKQANQGSSYGYLNLPKGVSVYAPTPGSTEKIDILPYTITDQKHLDLDADLGIEVGELWYKKPFKVHRGIGADNDTIVCPTTFGLKCPICEYRKKRASEKADKDELKEYNTSNRNLYAVIPIDVKKKKEEIHLFDFSGYLFQDLLNEELEEDDANEIFPDLEEGLTLKIRWAEEVFAGNKFAEAKKITFLKRDEAYDESILDDVPNLDECLILLSYKQIEAKFYQVDPDETDTEEKKETKKHSTASSKTKSHKKPKEDEEEPFKDDEDEEEKDEKPKSKKKPSRKVEVAEETELELTWDDLADMEEDELSEVNETKDLGIDFEDYNDEDEIREAIAEELGIEKPKKKSASKPSKPGTSKTSSGKCPHGHQFGVDTDDFPDDCDDCKVWSQCTDKKEE